MQYDTSSADQTSPNPVTIEIENGLTYNADQVSIEGAYSDEISLQRVKKTWCTILETDFLLIPKTDFQFQKVQNPNTGNFGIKCVFTSACGRYAFWRLLNEQVPEVQFLLETAHESHRFRDYHSFIESVTSSDLKDKKPLIQRILIKLIKQLDGLRDFFEMRVLR